MLQQRIITALVLVPLVVLAVFKLPVEYFSFIYAVIILLGAWEWCQLIGIHETKSKWLYLLAIILPMLFIFFWTQFLEALQYLIEAGQQGIYQKAKQEGWSSISNFMDNLNVTDVRSYSGILEVLVIPPVIFWVIVMVVIKNSPNGLLQMELSQRKQSIIGVCIFVAAWMFLSRLRLLYDSEMVMYLLLLIWAADIAAYFVGKKWGKTKLAPDISPGKTLAGFYGAIGAALICAVALCLIYGFPLINSADFILLSLLTVLISIYGDLFFSVAKRRSGIKESGSILPGHGGILDRIDSLIAATPFFYGGVYLIYRMLYE
jgi:phosphatidate cytidylyltransferase